MNKIKSFLCNTKPGNLSYGLVLFIVLAIEAWLVGFKIFFMVVGGIAASGAAAGVIGYGFFRFISWAQTKCKEKEKE